MIHPFCYASNSCAFSPHSRKFTNRKFNLMTDDVSCVDGVLKCLIRRERDDFDDEMVMTSPVDGLCLPLSAPARRKRTEPNQWRTVSSGHRVCDCERSRQTMHPDFIRYPRWTGDCIHQSACSCVNPIKRVRISGHYRAAIPHLGANAQPSGTTSKSKDQSKRRQCYRKCAQRSNYQPCATHA